VSLLKSYYGTHREDVAVVGQALCTEWAPPPNFFWLAKCPYVLGGSVQLVLSLLGGP